MREMEVLSAIAGLVRGGLATEEQAAGVIRLRQDLVGLQSAVGVLALRLGAHRPFQRSPYLSISGQG
jgi:hypothetical protein